MTELIGYGELIRKMKEATKPKAEKKENGGSGGE